jgi:hypothetical protein
MYPQSLHLCPEKFSYIIDSMWDIRSITGSFEDYRLNLLMAAWGFRAAGGNNDDNMFLFYWRQLTIQKRVKYKGILKDEN